MSAAAEGVDLVHCAGVNSCKGHNDCKTASNECKGMGSCKGHGFVAVPASACAAIGGNVIDQGMHATVATNTFIHCMGVNSCKGHNDCKTATNACKGQGSCKGQGFIELPVAACSNIGGTTG
ncbi:MAG: BufA2 family periplasmic bufferin-type metallophore [Arenimonas sp.]